MQTNDLPLAQQLAALMEAGRVANPSLQHIRGEWGDGKHKGCAMTFAFAGAGTTVGPFEAPVETFMRITGANRDEADRLMRRVIHMNDTLGASMEEIIAAVRDGTLPEAPARSHVTFYDDAYITDCIKSLKITYSNQFFNKLPDIQWIAFDPAAPAKISVGKVGDKLPNVDKGVRVSAKTGASWPKPKHAY